MSLTPGTRIGPYEITAQIGAGGMGEVYRATDTNLKRQVAIKVLPDAVASDAERLARFQREAEVLAALNHPNIAGLHGLEKSDRAIALVMELVDGPTLADRITQGAIPVDEALAIAGQIADALEAAHEQGIVHRDLKPANVKLRPDGTVKVLDFGLAKAIEPASAASSSLSMSPTITTPAMTQAGMILGTAAYMSPEQAKGRSADRRSDIWAFGVVLFEMLTGERAFDAPDVSDTMAAVLMRDPDWARLPAATPPAVAAALRLCLQRDRRQRARDIGDVRLALEGAFGGSTSAVVEGHRREIAAWRRALPLAAAALAGAIAVALVGWVVTPEPVVPPLNTFEHRIPVELPVTVQGLPATALSPDGRSVVYAALGGLYLRAMDTLEGRLIPGVGARVGSPTFSPDSRSVAYFDTSTVQLMRIATSGGAAVPIASIAPVVLPQGLSWAGDGMIYFGDRDGIHRVAATGGTPALVVPAEDGEVLSGPQLLPDGDTVLFTTASSASGQGWAQGSIVAQSLRTGERTVLVQGGNDGRYVAGGYLVYALEDVLYGAAFDVEQLTVRPDRVPLVQGVRRPPAGSSAGGLADFGVSADGTLMYARGGGLGDRSVLVWVDRQGREDPLNAPVRGYLYPRISPDGTRIAIDMRDEQDDIWIWHLERENLTRLTFDAGQDMYPVWSPDSTRIAYASQQGGGIPNIYWRRADGTGVASLLLEDPGELSPTAFSRDGSLVFTNRLGNFIASVSTDDEQEVSTLVAAENVTLHNADVSPDGRWVAYQSNESGMDEIYVRPFPDTESGMWNVSSGGGTRPVWARDGRELFYYLEPGQVMAVPVEAGDTFTYGNPQIVVDGIYNSGLGRTYDVSPDGQRFLMVKPAPSTDDATAGAGLVFVQHWTQELKRLVPAE